MKYNIDPPGKPLAVDLISICVVLDRNSIQPIFSPTSDNRVTRIRSVRHWKTQVNAVTDPMGAMKTVIHVTLSLWHLLLVYNLSHVLQAYV